MPARLKGVSLLCWLTLMTGLRAEEAAEFQYPLAVAATNQGTVYVADRNLPGIWKIEAGRRSILFQASKKFRTPLNAVRCLAIDHAGRLLAGDSSTRDVYRFDEQGRPTPLTRGRIGIPMSIAVANDGTIYTADLELHRIWRMPAEGLEQPDEFAVINSPRGLAMDPDGRLWVLSTSSQHGQIQQIHPDGTVEPFVAGHPFQLPHNIVRTDDGSLFVSDNYNHCIWRVSENGRHELWVQGHPLDRPVGLCRLADDLLIADPHIRTIFRLLPDRRLVVFSGPGPQTRDDSGE